MCQAKNYLTPQMDRINLQFNEEQGILNITSEGNISAAMIVELYETIINNKEYPRNLKLLIITPLSDFKLSPKHMQDIVSAAQKAYTLYDSLKEALVADGPYNTMIATLYSERSIMPNFQANVFSTKEAALKWLNE